VLADFCGLWHVAKSEGISFMMNDMEAESMYLLSTEILSFGGWHDTAPLGAG